MCIIANKNCWTWEASEKEKGSANPRLNVIIWYTILQLTGTKTGKTVYELR